MLLKCIGSGSAGNGFVLDDGRDILILDCGVPLIEAKIAIDFQISRVVGCVVTHEHKDHYGYIRQYEGSGRKIFAPFLYLENGDFQNKRFGNYNITSFPLVHDVPCFGFVIENAAFGRIVYATDTEYVKYRFHDVGLFIVEANYQNELLNVDASGTVKRDHVLRGHMELETTKRFLRQNVDDKTMACVLTHLSGLNADRQTVSREIQESVPCPVFVASKGMVMNIGS